jgi:hypothetical protein
MVAEVLLFIFLCLYHFAEGTTEGYTWAKPTRRKKNRLIQGRMGEGAAFLDYHCWRYGENIGIFFSVLVGAYIETCSGLILTLLGGWLAGSFCYERALNYVVTGKVWDDNKKEYHIMGLVIQRYRWQDWLALVLGVALFALALAR